MTARIAALVSLVVLAAWAIPGHAQEDAAPSPRDRAIREALAAASSGDPFLRANAIEALQPLPERVRPLVQLGVDDEASVVRFAALVTAGKLGLGETASAARARLNDADPSVRASAIYALHALGEPVDPSPLADLLRHREPRVRANAVRVVAWMGQPGAIEMVKDASRAPMPRASAEAREIARVQVAEAVVNLGDETAIDPVRAAAYSQFWEVKTFAILTLGRLDDRAMVPGLRPMMEDGPIEQRLAAAEALAVMGRSVGLEVALEGAEHPNPAVRSQAAFTLAALGSPAAEAALVAQLDDPSPQVRLSAAAGVLKRGGL